jgi:hypothetical protein
MATQGLVTITRKGVVTCKVICGCNGMQAPTLATHIRRAKSDDPRLILDLARTLKFGCQDCLVVQSSPTTTVPEEMDIEDDKHFYRDKFTEARFNPRWHHGTADYVILVELGPTKTAPSPRR